ncbi:MAG TPA: NAD(P)/FAD-dependent oxidoreductase [Pedobacter sp.]
MTQDVKTPKEISSLAKKQVAKYATVRFHRGLAVSGFETNIGFEIRTEVGESFTTKKLIFATGVKDLMPDLPGFSECWGISIIHCPYCHGYEVKDEVTGILANGDLAFNIAKEIHHWTKSLTLFTNGGSALTKEQLDKLKKQNIKINETKIARFEHTQGQLKYIQFKDGSRADLKALYARPPYEQHCYIPEILGCETTEQGHIMVDMFQKTTVRGVFACGDNSSPMRSVSNGVAMGTLAGVMVNKELIEEEFMSSPSRI